MTYDQQTFELAQSFISDSLAPKERHHELSKLLAVEIQTTIEDFMVEKEIQP